MALTISGTSNGKLGNLSLSNRTANVLDSGDTSFFNVDFWYLNSNQNGTITSGWVRAADTQPSSSRTGTWGSIGSGMTESSGVFTFPSTGIWKVCFGACTKNNAGSGTDTVYPIIQGTENNTDFANMQLTLTAFLAASKTDPTVSMVYFDCQDTSNYKIRFNAGSITTGYIEGYTTDARSYATFQRLGDT